MHQRDVPVHALLLVLLPVPSCVVHHVTHSAVRDVLVPVRIHASMKLEPLLVVDVP